MEYIRKATINTNTEVNIDGNSNQSGTAEVTSSSPCFLECMPWSSCITAGPLTGPFYPSGSAAETHVISLCRTYPMLLGSSGFKNLKMKVLVRPWTIFFWILLYRLSRITEKGYTFSST